MKSNFKLFLYLILNLFLLSDTIFGQGSAGDAADQELVRLVDFPTAGTLKSGYIGFDINILNKGLLITGINFAPFKNLNLGISYGAAGLIGTDSPEFYSKPGFRAKLKVFTETRNLPSFAIGFDNQGKGEYIDSLERYEIKSPGLYLCVTKNFKFLGYLSFHSIINYSLENIEDDKSLNFGFGLEKTIGPFLSFLGEYDLGLNNSENSKTNKGYLNLGIRWAISGNLTIGFDFKDLLNNNQFKKESNIERAFYLEYFTKIF